MPSINLLPENFSIEVNKKKEKTTIYIMAVAFLSVTAIAGSWAYVEKRAQAKRADYLDTEITQVKSEIKRTVESSALLASEASKNDIQKLLKNHVYYSKGMGFFKDMIVKDAYVIDMKFASASTDIDNVTIKLAARDNDAMAEEFSLLRDSFWIRAFTPGSIAPKKDSGVVADVKMSVRKDLFAFHEQYWDYGIGKLAAACNRYVDIKSYGVINRKIDNAVTGAREEQVVVNFQGEAFDASRLNDFENKLRAEDNVISLSLTKNVEADQKPGVTGFVGNLVLKH